MFFYGFDKWNILNSSRSCDNNLFRLGFKDLSTLENCHKKSRDMLWMTNKCPVQNHPTMFPWLFQKFDSNYTPQCVWTFLLNFVHIWKHCCKVFIAVSPSKQHKSVVKIIYKYHKARRKTHASKLNAEIFDKYRLFSVFFCEHVKVYAEVSFSSCKYCVIRVTLHS